MKKTGLITIIMLLSFIEVMAQCTHCSSGSSSTGTNASAIGTETEASGHSAFSSGVQSIANESYTTAIGFHAEASYTKAIAIGSTIRTTGYQSITLGSGDFNSGSYLTNNIPRSLMVGFNSIYPTLVVFGITSPQYHNKTGYVGIGNVTEPEAKLHIRSDADSSATLYLQPYAWNAATNAQIWMGNKNNGISADYGTGMVYHTENNHVFEGGSVFVTNGSVGIGTNQTNGYKLAVNGKILAEEIKVMEDVPGSDYVFEKNYHLLNLTDLEKYVQKNKHLPEVKSAEEFKNQGYKIGEMDDVLLRKIEELTLYTIKQQKMIEKQAKILESQQKQIDELIKTK